MALKKLFVKCKITDHYPWTKQKIDGNLNNQPGQFIITILNRLFATKIPRSLYLQSVLKQFLPILLLFLCAGFLQAQNKMDSLNRLIAISTSDTQRINRSIGKIRELTRSNFDTAISFAEKIINQSKSIGYAAGEGQARTSSSVAYFYKGDFSRGKESLLVARDIFLRLNDSIWLAKVFSNFGIMFSMQNKHDSALLQYEEASKIFQLKHELSLLGGVYQNMAIAYQQQSLFPLALTFYQKAQVIAEKEKDEADQAYLAVNIAITYTMIGDTVRAEQSFLKAIGFAQKSDLKAVATYAYSNLSSLYGDKNLPEKEYEFGMKAADLAKEIGDLGIEASSLSRAAFAQATMRNFAEAEKISLKSLIIGDSSGQPLNIYQTNAVMGTILTLQKKYKQGIPYFENAISRISSTDLYDRQVAGTYYSYSECLENTGNYRKALETYKAAKGITDSLGNKNKIRLSTEITMNAEFDKKQQIAKVEQEKKDAVAKTKQTGLIAGLMLTLILGLVAFNGFRNKRKSNSLLQQQKDEIQTTLKELKITQGHLIQAEKMASLGELTAGIAHEIQNPLNFVNNFSGINAELIEEATQYIDAGNIAEARATLQDIKSNEEKINHHGSRADGIVKGMLLHSRSGTGQKEMVDLNKMAEEYLRMAYHGAKVKDNSFNALITTAIDPSIGYISMVPQDISRVLLNLYGNAFYAVRVARPAKGGQYEPAVELTTKKEGDHVIISIKDNGAGIPDSLKNKIFEPFFTTKPTGQGTGLGLSLSYDIIKAHGGELTVHSEDGAGAEFIISLPA